MLHLMEVFLDLFNGQLDGELDGHNGVGHMHGERTYETAS